MILTNQKDFLDILEIKISDHSTIGVIIKVLIPILLVKTSKDGMNNHTTNDYSYFQNIFLKFLTKHATIQKKILRFNNNAVMPKPLRKPIMHGSKLKNIYDKLRTEGY